MATVWLVRTCHLQRHKKYLSIDNLSTLQELLCHVTFRKLKYFLPPQLNRWRRREAVSVPERIRKISIYDKLRKTERIFRFVRFELRTFVATITRNISLDVVNILKAKVTFYINVSSDLLKQKFVKTRLKLMLPIFTRSSITVLTLHSLKNSFFQLYVSFCKSSSGKRSLKDSAEAFSAINCSGQSTF